MPDHVIRMAGRHNNWLYGILLLYGVVLFSGALLINRSDFYFLLCWQIILHACYFTVFKMRHVIKLKHLIWAAVLLRIGMAFITPSLSEDVYRFVWDGQLIRLGDNPMLSTPDGYLAALADSAPVHTLLFALHSLINHPQYYTCYPPVMQGIFWLSAVLGFNSIGVSVVIIKLVLALADGVTIWFLIKILKKLKLDTGLVILYALHPLVIVEGSGNAHFEVMQAAFMSGSIYFLLLKKTNAAAIFWGLAIATKLLPLLLLPLLWLHLGLKKGFRFCCISVAILVIFFLPFLSWEAVSAFSQSINLFIQQFEFNASVYYLVRAIGFWLTGYNQVAILGPLLLGIFMLIYAWLLIRRRSNDPIKFAFTSLILFTLYFLFSTTVHPWYIITILPFAIITRSYFPFLWMTTAFLSYSAYTTAVVKENAWLIMLEYGAVAVLLIIEWKNNEHYIQKKSAASPAKNEFS